jgi:hypothetical protein
MASTGPVDQEKTPEDGKTIVPDIHKDYRKYIEWQNAFSKRTRQEAEDLRENAVTSQASAEQQNHRARDAQKIMAVLRETYFLLMDSSRKRLSR